MSLKVKAVVQTLCVAAVVGLASAVMAVTGDGSLVVPGATNTPTHFNVSIGVPIVCEIRNIPAHELGGSYPATLDVWVKSSYYGNTQYVATRIGLTSNYTFTVTLPAIANGDAFNACGTTIVAYKTLGRNANNDWCDDGVINGSFDAASGLRPVDSFGAPLECTPVPVEPSTWSTVKDLFK